MIRLILALAAGLLTAPMPAAAQSYCDVQPTGLNLPIPRNNTPFNQWGTCTRNSFIILNSSGAGGGGSSSGTWYEDGNYVRLSTPTDFVYVESWLGVGKTPDIALDILGGAMFGENVLRSTFSALPGGSVYALSLSTGLYIGGGGPIRLGPGSFLELDDGTIISSLADLGGNGHAIENEGVAVTQRSTMNFVGPNVNVTDTGGKTQVTITSNTAGHVVEDEGSPVTQRANMNFTGSGVSVADSGGKTVVTIAGATGGHAIEDEGTPVVQRDTMNFVGPGISVSDVGGKTQVLISTEGAVDTIRSTHTLVPMATTASPSWTSIPGSTLTLVQDGAQYVRAYLNCNIECLDYSGCGVSFGILVNGSFIDGQTDSPATGIKYIETENTNDRMPKDLTINHKTVSKVAGGVNTFSLVWASTGAVSVRMGYNMLGCSLTYAESPRIIFSGATGVLHDTEDFGSRTNAEIAGLTCPDFPSVLCRVQSKDDPFDLFISTAVNGFMGLRTGQGPNP